LIITEIINHIYTDESSQWIVDIDESDIQPFVIQKWLVMNDNLRNQVRLLDKYVFTLPPKMYLSLVWSVMPKVKTLPYIPYIKQVDEGEELGFLLDMVKKEFKMSDSDFKSVRSRLIKSIKSDMQSWFMYYGIEKSLWKKFMVSYSVMEKA
jgi:hypothetical protein